MNITLISTATFPSDQGIRTISSILKKQGHYVNVVFMTLGEDYSRNYNKQELFQLEKICRESRLIGISSFASTAQRAERVIRFLKSVSKIPIIYGGVHATLFPEKCIELTDFVCVGEGEDAILELVKSIENNKSPDKIKNLWIKKPDGKIKKNYVRNLKDNLKFLT